MKNHAAKDQRDIGLLIQQAVAHLQQGRLQEAQTLAQKVLSVNENHAEANHLMGIITAQRGQYELAERLIANATRFKPKYAEAHISHGNVLNTLGRPEKALAAYKRAIQLKPQYAVAHYNRGNVLKDLGHLEDALAAYDRAIQLKLPSAEAHINRGAVLNDLDRPKQALVAYQQAIRLNPRSAEAHNNLGTILSELNHTEQALAAYEQAIRLSPQSAEARFNLSNLLRKLGRLDEALAGYEQTIQLNPEYAEAYINLGNLLKETGRFNEALVNCEQAIRLIPQSAEAHYNRGNLLRDLGRREDALAAYDQAIKLNPRSAEAHGSRGFVLWELWRLHEALEAFDQAIKLNPQSAEAHGGRANTLWELCYLDEAESSYRRALKEKPDYEEAHSNLIFLLAAKAELSPDNMLDEQRSWDRIHGQEGRMRTMPVRKVAARLERRIRVGYVSPDLRRHAVSYFFEPLLAAHDRNRFEVFCYATHSKHRSDSTTDRLRESSEHWRFVEDKSDEDLAKLIHEDGIDILVDLAGHTAKNRLKTFTYKPAPVQATYLGFIAASGMEAMDYWITDEILHPPGIPEQAIERIYRLPRCSFCYQPPVEAPAVSPCPSNDDQVVFGSFCNLSKLTPEVIETWSQVLHRLPSSRLLLMSKPLAEPETRQLILDRFARRKIKPEQLIIRESSPLDEYFATYSRVDIVLDSFPRTGGTTTAETLWMGVPVVTLAGQRYAERISASKLTAVGLKELITHSREEYIEKALSLARNPEWRAALRANLREKMSQSQLCDGESLAREMESGYLSMLERSLTGTNNIIIKN